MPVAESEMNQDFEQMDPLENERISPVGSYMESNFTSVSGSRRVVQQDAQQSRIRQRIDACRIGLQKLDVLRDKHQQIMQEMRSQLGLPSDPALESLPEIYVSVSQGGQAFGQDRGPPTDEWSLVLRTLERSANRLRSICSAHSEIRADLSPLQELKQFRRQQNPVMSPEGTILGKMRQKFFASKLTEKLLEKGPERGRHLSISTIDSRGSFCEDEGISADLMNSVIESTAALPTPVPAPRLRKQRSMSKANQKKTSPVRPKSLYTYPEENTVVVESLPKVVDKKPSSPVQVSKTLDRRSPRAMRSPRIVRSESVQMLRGHTESLPNVNSLTRSMSVVNARAPSESCVFRASRVFINLKDISPPGTPKVVTRATSTPPSRRRVVEPSRPQSIASGEPYESQLDNSLMVHSKKNKTTWEDVKRMLDPLFEERTSPKLAQRRTSPILTKRKSSESDCCGGGGTLCKFVTNGGGSTGGSVFVSSSKSSPLLTPRQTFVAKAAMDISSQSTANHGTLSRSVRNRSENSVKLKHR